jgi:hypothetical protein
MLSGFSSIWVVSSITIALKPNWDNPTLAQPGRLQAEKNKIGCI